MKLSTYSELPVVLRLSRTGQEMHFTMRPGEEKFHVSAQIGAETYSGFFEFERVAVSHPDDRVDMRLMLTLPKEDLAKTTIKKTTRAIGKSTPLATTVEAKLADKPSFFDTLVKEAKEEPAFVLPEPGSLDPLVLEEKKQELLATYSGPPKEGESQELKEKLRALEDSLRVPEVEDIVEEPVLLATTEFPGAEAQTPVEFDMKGKPRNKPRR